MVHLVEDLGVVFEEEMMKIHPIFDSNMSFCCISSIRVEIWLRSSMLCLVLIGLSLELLLVLGGRIVMMMMMI